MKNSFSRAKTNIKPRAKGHPLMISHSFEQIVCERYNTTPHARLRASCCKNSHRTALCARLATLSICFYGGLFVRDFFVTNVPALAGSLTYVCVASWRSGPDRWPAGLCCRSSWSRAQAAALRGALHGSCASSAAPRAALTAVHLGTAGRVVEFRSSRRMGGGGGGGGGAKKNKNWSPLKIQADT